MPISALMLRPHAPLLLAKLLDVFVHLLAHLLDLGLAKLELLIVVPLGLARLTLQGRFQHRAVERELLNVLEHVQAAVRVVVLLRHPHLLGGHVSELRVFKECRCGADLAFPFLLQVILEDVDSILPAAAERVNVQDARAWRRWRSRQHIARQINKSTRRVETRRGFTAGRRIAASKPVGGKGIVVHRLCACPLGITLGKTPRIDANGISLVALTRSRARRIGWLAGTQGGMRD
eukprot:scaffold5143_cov119-Isochrysis_galbana.AAC.21